ncbi:hypothetical protein [Micromonospora sp. WMMD1219]|uniref:hypothetical protein n=1 Tax=Micromonospora sp. WMMD1219 TaxID=3404115 RepID=UPI003BF4E99E
MIDVTFGDDIPLPAVNVEAYRAIYRIENWLRRITLAAYMNKYGTAWPSHIDPQLRGALRGRVQANGGRIYLNAESDDNLIWLTMHKELRRLLLDEEIWPFVQRILSLPKDALGSKLLELNEIRNMLAHNRALTPTTSVILAGLCASFEAGIHRFKMETLYGYGEILGEDEGQPLIEELRDQVGVSLMTASGYQAFVSMNQNVYELVCLPVERHDRDWVNVAALLKTYRSSLSSILSFCLNAEGSEYRILLPRSLAVEEIAPTYAKFANNPPIWTEKPYSNQSDKYLHNPKVWFYQNQTPED